jgi:hypothetical protein
MGQADDTLPRDDTHQRRCAKYLILEVLFAAGAALCFLDAYSFAIYVQARSEPGGIGGHPASMIRLYGPALGSAAFLGGLICLLWQDHQRPALNKRVLILLLAGLLAVLGSRLWPDVWR